MSSANASNPATPAVRRTRLLIDNQWREGADGQSFETLNPATGESIAAVAAGTAIDVDLAVQAARRALDDGAWGTMDAADRGRLLYRLADLIEQNAEALAALESLNSGKTITDSRDDMTGSVNILRYFAGWADKIEGRTLRVRGSYHAYTVRQPVGVVGQIIPWNFPVYTLATKIAPALACGCTVIVKPAEQTPLSALYVGELAIEAGLPPGVFNIINGFGETAGAALCVHPGVDKIAFTGHVETAKIIHRATAETLKRTTYELGGKSPNVVFSDCNLDDAVAGSFQAIYLHGGQSCSAGSRLFVEQSIHHEFVGRLVERAKSLKVGDQLDPQTEQGPQINQEQLDKILGYVDVGQNEGATLLTGGRQIGNRGYFMQPTIFDNVTDRMTIARDEIFGPVLTVLTFSDIDELIERANDTQYGLAAAVWTRNIDKAHTFANAVNAGTVWVNCYNVIDPSTPFGGFKMSGYGRDFGAAALDHYTEIKTVTVKLN